MRSCSFGEILLVATKLAYIVNHFKLLKVDEQIRVEISDQESRMGG